jgi:hypothetical protein
MPIHDWTQVDAGIFHDFHQAWITEIRNALNGGGLPGDYFALAEQVLGGPMPDVITLQQTPPPREPAANGGGVGVAEAPPRARFVRKAQLDPYVAKANRLRIQHRLGRVVAVVEIVSPGNKSSQHAIRAFTQKAEELFREGISLLLIDLFPPTPRDPQGIHKVIWDTVVNEPFELPADKRLTVAAYAAGSSITAYVEPVAVGDKLPSLPIFLDAGLYVPAPLETSYEATWSKLPQVVKEFVLSGRV